MELPFHWHARYAEVRGVYVIAPTSFHDDGRVDEASTDRMTDFFVQSGVTGITVLGQMGEAPKLEHQETLARASRVIRRASVPIIVGVSSAAFAAIAQPIASGHRYRCSWCHDCASSLSKDGRPNC
jgi:dihydrodipicolinate synthase/N-acetylneuraminate lyase